MAACSSSFLKVLLSYTAKGCNKVTALMKSKQMLHRNIGRISQDLGACSTQALRADLNWTANWEYGIRLDRKHLGCYFFLISSVSSQLIATLFRFLWPGLGLASSACCGLSCAEPVTGSSGWCFPLFSLLSPLLPPLLPFVPPA